MLDKLYCDCFVKGKAIYVISETLNVEIYGKNKGGINISRRNENVRKKI